MLADSPLLNFRQLVESWVERQPYGTVNKPDMWDGGDPQEELCRILITRELFAAFVNTRRLEEIILDEKEIDREELRERLCHLVRRPNRRRGLSQETNLVFVNFDLLTNALMEAAIEYRQQYRESFLWQRETQTPSIAPTTRAERRAMVDAYIEEVFRQTGNRITRTAVWKKAGYRSRTEFERWERSDPRASKTAHQRFTNLLLIEKPHLK